MQSCRKCYALSQIFLLLFAAILSDDPGDITWAAILTWGMSDGLVRIINGKTKPAVNFIQHSPFEEVKHF